MRAIGLVLVGVSGLVSLAYGFIYYLAADASAEYEARNEIPPVRFSDSFRLETNVLLVLSVAVIILGIVAYLTKSAKPAYLLMGCAVVSLIVCFPIGEDMWCFPMVVALIGASMMAWGA